MDHFTQLDKAEQKHHLIMEWGHLIYPLEELARSATPPPIANYRQALSSFLAGGRAMQDHIRVFCTFNDIILQPNRQSALHCCCPGPREPRVVRLANHHRRIKRRCHGSCRPIHHPPICSIQ